MIKAPRIYIKNSQDQMIAVLDGDYHEDTLERYLSGKASIFSCKFYKKEYDYQNIVAGCKLAFEYNGEDFWMNIMNVYQDEYTMEIEAWSLSLELNNEMKNAYSAPKPMTFVEYAQLFDFKNAFEIGINEISDQKIQSEWSGESTLLARILSLATIFDAEIEFVTENDQFHHLDKIVLNIYKKHSDVHQGLGKDRRSEVFRYGKELVTVKKTEDVSELYTGIKAYGKDGLTLSGYSKEEKNEDGVVEYYTFNEMVRAPLARDRFPSNVKLDNDRYITYYWDSDDTTQEALYNNALAKLKELSVPKVTWEIEGFVDVSIGDSITIADDGYKPTLYLEARVSEQMISFTEPNRNKTTFTNAVEVSSEISADLLDKMQALIEANKKYDYQILTDNGTVFKNGVGTTTLTARVLDNAKEVTDNFTIGWKKNDATLVNAKKITINASDVNEKAVYRYEATDSSGIVKGGYEVTVTNIDDGEKGEDGKTSYLHTAYSWNSDGTDRFTKEYPNENLLLGSSKNLRTVNMGPWNTNISDVISLESIGAKVGDTITFRLFFKNPATALAGTAARLNLIKSDGTYNVWVGNYIAVDNEGYSEVSWKITNEYTAIQAYIQRENADGTGEKYTIQAKEDKLEISEKATVYTTHPLEDPINAYPTYIGTYTDFKETGTKNPPDYEWAKIAGSTQYNHVAWKMADGSFTEVYPNENLVTGTTFEKETDWSLRWSPDNGKLELTAEGNKKINALVNSQTGIGQPMTVQPVEGDVLTLSFQFRGTGTIEPFYLMETGGNLAIGTISAISSTVWTTYKKTYTFPNRVEGVSYLAILTRGEGKWLEIKKDSIKLELSSSSTNWTPTPSEDFENAYPKFRGEYTDFSEQASEKPELYTWSRIIGTSGKDGVPGKDGTPGKDGAPGKGITASSNEYAISESGTVVPTSGWSYTPLVPQAGKYQWTRTRYKYTDGSYSDYLYTINQYGKDGIIVSESAPTNPQLNQLWQNPKDTTGSVKRWDGKAWVTWGVSIDNIVADNLEVENGVFKKVTGITIEGSEFVNEYSYHDAASEVTGIASIGSGTYLNMFSGGVNNGGMFIIRQNGDIMCTRNESKEVFELFPGGMFLQNKDFYGMLTPEMLYDSGWVNQTIANGSGAIKVKKHLGRILIWFDNYVQNGKSRAFTLPDYLNPKKAQMKDIEIWTEPAGKVDRFQLNTDGGLWKMSNNSQTLPFRQIIEVF